MTASNCLNSSKPRAVIARLRSWSYLSKALRKAGTGGRDKPPLPKDVAGAVAVETALNTPLSSNAHIDSFPPEVMGEIFFYCLPSEQYPYIAIDDAPMLLCQICSYWRQVALSLPSLWSNFNCDIGYEASASHAMLLQLWIDRSRTTPLSLAFTPTPALAATLKVLVTSVCRWHDIRVALDAEVGRTLVSILGKEASQLESICIAVRERNWDADQLISQLNVLSNLRRLTWDASFLPPALVNMAWPRLTEINIAGRLLSASDSIALLSNTRALEHAYLGVVDPSSESLPSRPVVTLQHLRSLKFYADDPGQIFDNFAFPSLLSLETSRPDDPHALRRLDERSSCKLEVFSIESPLDAEEAVSYLRLPCMQSVTSLGLVINTRNDRVITFLTWNPDTPFDEAILPWLTKLTLTVEKTTDGAIGRMIASRWLPQRLSASLPASLKKVELWYNGDRPLKRGVEYHSVDIAYFKHLTQEGLDISWTCACSFYPLHVQFAC
ncbi:hypothetical protein Hypma_016512 [Hypsizygus marmoreus]|uniref:F-box domain-containing protein n=1 Tax=Hypsizygus marmoreus TaxID=39966 RepID=A0A369IXY1_HYPMA|nr:hypothetical protein Hypma_016512 [Hypsizygus marmoreus]